MTYERIMKEITEDKVCRMELIYKLIGEIFEKEREEEEGYQEIQDRSVGRLMDAICKEDVKLVGSSDVIHNVSVECAINGYQDHACRILKKGLEITKNYKDIDLLADYLKYSIDSLEEDDEFAGICYQRLCGISKKFWSWRAFEFSVDYLLKLKEHSSSSEEEFQEKSLQLALEYRDRMKNSGKGDRAYNTLASVYLKGGERDKYIETLNEAYTYLKRVPLCALNLAEVEFENGEYDAAEIHISDCIKMNVAVDNSINMGYPYILSALCQMMLIYNGQRDKNDTDRTRYKETIKAIERNYDSAKRILGEHEKKVKNLKKQIEIFKKQFDMNNEEEQFDE